MVSIILCLHELNVSVYFMPDMCVNLDVHTRAINCPCLISGTSYYAPGNSFQTY